MSLSVINSELIVLFDLPTKVREREKMLLKIFRGSAKISFEWEFAFQQVP